MSDNKREAILNVAKDCFTKFGYKKTTLDDIGHGIGLNKASIYHYFKGGKEEIFISIAMDEFNEFIEKLQIEVIQATDCHKRIITYIIRKIEFWTKKATVLRMIHEINPSDIQILISSGISVFQDIEKSEMEFFSSILQECINSGHIRNYDVYKLSNMIFALADGIKDRYMKLHTGVSIKPEDYADMMDDIKSALDIFVSGLEVISGK